jgi:hypothetical protein
MILTTTPSGTPMNAWAPCSNGKVLLTTGLNPTIDGSSNISRISIPEASTSASPDPAGGRYSKEMDLVVCLLDWNAARKAFRPDGLAMFSGLTCAVSSGGTNVMILLCQVDFDEGVGEHLLAPILQDPLGGIIGILTTLSINHQIERILFQLIHDGCRSTRQNTLGAMQHAERLCRMMIVPSRNKSSDVRARPR